MSDYPVESAARLLMSAASICVSSGAGMSAESGIPTFRDENGLWSRFNPAEIASPEGFARDPVKLWEWYRWRRKELAATEPHEGHRAIAAWEQRCSDVTVVTQNIDGLHHRAGSQNVIELHGRLDRVICTSCPHEIIGLDDLGPDPHCPECGARLRPGVVWFGELLPEDALTAAVDAMQLCDVLVLIGTSGEVQPAASLAYESRAAGAKLIEINPNVTPLSALCDVCIRDGCRSALTAINEIWRPPSR